MLMIFGVQACGLTKTRAQEEMDKGFDERMARIKLERQQEMLTKEKNKKNYCNKLLRTEIKPIKSTSVLISGKYLTLTHYLNNRKPTKKQIKALLAYAKYKAECRNYFFNLSSEDIDDEEIDDDFPSYVSLNKTYQFQKDMLLAELISGKLTFGKHAKLRKQSHLEYNSKLLEVNALLEQNSEEAEYKAKMISIEWEKVQAQRQGNRIQGSYNIYRILNNK